MNLPPTEVAALRQMLQSIDGIERQIDDLAAPISIAEAAQARLREKLAELARPEAAPPTIAVDAQRLDALLDGKSVPLPDRKVVEAQEALASKVRLLSVQRQQIEEDINSVGRHLGSLHNQANGLRQQIAQIERGFAVALGTALWDAYRRDITSFVIQRVPELLSVADRIGVLTGKVPDWRANVTSGLEVRFPDDAYNAKAVATGNMGRSHVLWPRHDGYLISDDGTPVAGRSASSPQIVNDLIAELRTGA